MRHTELSLAEQMHNNFYTGLCGLCRVFALKKEHRGKLNFRIKLCARIQQRVVAAKMQMFWTIKTVQIQHKKCGKKQALFVV